MAAQSPAEAPPAPEMAFSDSVAVGLVLVPVVVRSRRGYVDGLDRDDFQLFVDGQPIPIESFERRAEAPLSLVFLQDLSGSMAHGGKLEASREALRFFLERAGSSDELAVATFAGETTAVEVPFTHDISALWEASETWEAYGTTALHDAVAWLPEISAGGRQAKRAALLVTDGADNASTLSPAEAREAVRHAQLPVYVLGMSSGDPFTVDRTGRKIHRFADVLNLLAHFTGGRYFPVTGPDELKEALWAISEDLRHQYVLGFSPGPHGPPRHRRIRVEVAGKGRTVIARQGYYGMAPKGSTN